MQIISIEKEVWKQRSERIKAIKDILNANAVQSSDEYVKELMDKGKGYIEKGRKLKTR